MEHQNPSFTFLLEYNGKTVSCEVLMKSQSYDILFDGQWMASIAYSDEWTWIQASGVILPDSVIEEIGTRVEGEYQ